MKKIRQAVSNNTKYIRDSIEQTYFNLTEGDEKVCSGGRSIRYTNDPRINPAMPMKIWSLFIVFDSIALNLNEVFEGMEKRES
jgi:hypothetical protein